MKNHSIAITGILLAHLLLVGSSVAAADSVTIDTVDTSSAEWKECLRLLRLDKTIAQRGTYRVRMVNCVNDVLQKSATTTDLSRGGRLQLRIEQVQSRLVRTTRAQPASISNATKIEERRVVPTTLFRQYTRITTPRTSTRTIYSRPSRRSIQRDARL